ncbi:CdaR family transcriptional regulator [Rhodococcus sp. 15-725-2-2b]|uniref:helix-turn-helix domain-containing protein n=1 Tax=unclassified Rhodococcus (in: high G+C Gram-positive bacteria) TaxID=192944 RepID=UPI000B9ACE4E|nr:MULTISPECIES: helix-turn-helix domain-containing protein [unclassified Rhodococcus (in: high G+C Gram-positive bacteria)]OZC62049.1 CdaR family transcriptional regulator [Rhodococcus sp. 06-470-2]OZC65034.1 CdaR family transcriptional regulator [Rhodococcus sp. 06-469-3-2]OZE26774.1 CdaR family transcriptional regulator [Rhodococcus sp. 05-2254-5]OZE52754.1 CdaR family transcriptional regulator [Rhodococcus sp. 05-2254-1]OZE57750.1 CdaR family transcriptional regulator [Rhodococcus sp. 05-2
MQELLGRIARLDPTASLGLRIIACFDELVVGNVNTRALLASAASLSGCVVGFGRTEPDRIERIAPDGNNAPGPAPERRTDLTTVVIDDLCVWLEREGPHRPNDAIVLERLALAVKIRHGHGRRELDNRRHFGLLVDQTVSEEQRRLSSAALGLSTDCGYRVVTAPLFAVWKVRPSGPEDVVPTQFGPLHAIIAPERVTAIDASPCGIGVATTPKDLHHSFRTSIVALRLCDDPQAGPVDAADFGGLADLLADTPGTTRQPDVEKLATVLHHTWGSTTVRAIVQSGSLREAAREAGVHHSTMQTRVLTITELLGFDPFVGFGRTRLGTAYLVWRLNNSRVLEMPPP